MEEENVGNNLGENQEQIVGDNLNQSPAPVSPVAPISQPVINIEDTPQVKYAGFWIRWVAILIDGIVVAVMTIPIMIAFYFLSGGSFSFLDKDSEMPLGFNFLGYIISWSYYIFMTDKYQATLGKKAMGIIVVTENFQKASLGNIILRETVGKIISGIILCIGYLMAAFTDRKRALHDMISGTVVIYKDSSTKMSNGAIIGIVAAIFLFFIVIFGILASIVLVSLSSARDKASVMAFKSEVMSLAAGSIVVCDEEVLSQNNPANAGKFLGKRNFIAGTSSTECGPNGSGEFNFTIDSVGLPEKCTATLTNQETTFEGC